MRSGEASHWAVSNNGPTGLRKPRHPRERGPSSGRIAAGSRRNVIVAWIGISEGFRKCEIFQNFVCRDLRLQLAINRHAMASSRISPNLVIAATRASELISGVPREPDDI